MDIHQLGDGEYMKVYGFAKKIYWERLEFDLSSFPDFLFSISDGEEIVGCMGMNGSIRCPLFVNDKRFKDFLDGGLAEQSILAVSGYSYGLPLLIAIVARYAHYLGFEKIIFAGIDVSIKAIKHIGFEIMECGLADQAVLPEEEKRNFSKWFGLHKPIVCVLETKQSLSVSKRLLDRFGNKINLSGKLMKVFSGP